MQLRLALWVAEWPAGFRHRKAHRRANPRNGHSRQLKQNPICTQLLLERQSEDFIDKALVALTLGSSNSASARIAVVVASARQSSPRAVAARNLPDSTRLALTHGH